MPADASDKDGAMSDAAIDRMLDAARAKLDRVPPEHLGAEMAAGALVVDIRPEANRREEGELPGSVVLERNVLEWRLDPTSPHRIPDADDPDRRVILVCNEGYASSLAAAALRELGLLRATDLDGGYRAWALAARPSERTASPVEAEPSTGRRRAGRRGAT
jgi:rhodanese-related sulfurtransferase